MSAAIKSNNDLAELVDKRRTEIKRLKAMDTANERGRIAMQTTIEELRAEAERLKAGQLTTVDDATEMAINSRYNVGKEAAAKIAEDQAEVWREEAASLGTSDHAGKVDCLARASASESVAAAIRGSINDPDEADHGNKQFLSGFRAKDAD